jgi:hypothetical protein
MSNRGPLEEDFTATVQNWQASSGLNYKMARKFTEIKPKSNQVGGQKRDKRAQTRISELEQNPKIWVVTSARATVGLYLTLEPILNLL